MVTIGEKVNIDQKVNIGQISEILNFNPIKLKFEEHLHIRSMNSTTSYFWGKHWPKGQNRPKGQLFEILTFHPIELKFEDSENLAQIGLLAHADLLAYV